MTRSGKHFEEFAEHTRLKHLILEKYIQAWSHKLLLGTPVDQIWFVDAFAGEGQDSKGNPGSPLIAAEIARTVNAEVAARGRDKKLRVLAIEKKKARYEKLRDLLLPFRKQQIAAVRHGTLAQVVDGFRRYVGDRPVMYFLDPFGVRGLLAELLPKLFTGPYNEVFLLFSNTGAIRLHAVLDASKRDVKVEMQRRRPQQSLFSEENDAAEAQVRAEVERHAKALDVTKPRAAKILLEAFGPERFEELCQTPKHEREAKALGLYVDLLAEAGAKYVLPFPIRNDRNRQVYHLVYATQSGKGMRAMKEALTASIGQIELPREVRESISVPLRVDVADIADQVARRFAGKTAAWNDPDGRSSAIWPWALEETTIFPRQREELQEELERRFPTASRPLMFRIP